MSARLTDEEFEGHLGRLWGHQDIARILRAHIAAILESERDLLAALERIAGGFGVTDAELETMAAKTDNLGAWCQRQARAALANARRQDAAQAAGGGEL